MSLRNHIIKSAAVEGVIYCSSEGEIDTVDREAEKEKEHLKALEEYWFNKGRSEGEEKGYKEGVARGDEEGYLRGREKGLLTGADYAAMTSWQEGLREGYLRGEEELQEVTELSKKVLEELTAMREDFYEHAKAEFIHFSLTVCRQVLQRELQAPEVLEQMVRMVLQEALPLMTDEQVEVHLHPEDQGSLAKRLEDLHHVRWMPNPSVRRGACKVRTELGMVHFEVERMLKDIEQKVLEVHQTAEMGSAAFEGVAAEEEDESVVEIP